MLRVRRQVSCVHVYTGAGTTAAILDTGIAAHPDFDQRILGFADFVNGRCRLYDDDGHGTHVAGILAGSGKLSAGKYAGIAPGCQLVVGKVLDGNGDGSIEHMLQGLGWILDKQKQWNIRILNVSVGLDLEKRGRQKERLLELLEEVCRRGIVVVAAAGNAGPAPGSLSPIGASGQVIAVGCHEGGYFGKRTDLCEYHSGREAAGARIRKPDLVAPGTDITSCSHLARETAHGWQNGYAVKSGTSMAAPLVSGAAALCMERFPGADNREVKKRILYSARDLGEPWEKQGWGMLNIQRMLYF